MSLQYGIGLAEETIIRLNNSGTPVDRLLRAWSEIDVMEDDDTSAEWFEAVVAWKAKYLSRSTEIHQDEYNQQLIDDLLFICGAIVTENTQLVQDEDEDET